MSPGKPFRNSSANLGYIDSCETALREAGVDSGG